MNREAGNDKSVERVKCDEAYGKMDHSQWESLCTGMIKVGAKMVNMLIKISRLRVRPSIVIRIKTELSAIDILTCVQVKNNRS